MTAGMAVSVANVDCGAPAHLGGTGHAFVGTKPPRALSRAGAIV